MKPNRFFAMFGIALTLGFAALTVIPEDAEARRFGGGRSFGSRGSRSFSVPRQPTQRSTMQQRQTTQSRQSSAMAGNTGGSRFGSGLMGGIGGLLLGGMIGSMLFGGGGVGGAGGGGIGLLEILLIGGGIWFFMRWLRRKKAGERAATMSPMGGGSHESPMEFSRDDNQGGPLPERFETGGGGDASFNQPTDEVSQGIEHIMQMDPSFREDQFIDGAKQAYKMIQSAWSDWSVDRLRPLLTDRMWGMVQAQAEERKDAGMRDIIEKIDFKTAEVSEAWQESGENWITMRFVVSMIEYSTDVEGNLKEGSMDTTVEHEECWTFTRPVGAQDPNWFLAAIQQPDEVARSSS